jgi:hypothetical protein
LLIASAAGGEQRMALGALRVLGGPMCTRPREWVGGARECAGR